MNTYNPNAPLNPSIKINTDTGTTTFAPVAPGPVEAAPMPGVPSSSPVHGPNDHPPTHAPTHTPGFGPNVPDSSNSGGY